MNDRWDSTPRMLGEQCDGRGGWSVEVYALDLPNDVRLWLCKSCWLRLDATTRDHEGATR